MLLIDGTHTQPPYHGDSLMHGILQKLLLFPKLGYPALFRAGEGEAGKKGQWYPTSAAPLLVQIGSLTATSSSGYWVMGHLCL